MATRSIRAGSLTNKEVGIVRNLLARGDYKNQDILGLINTVRRLEGKVETNGGRKSEVKTNKPRYKGIKALSNSDTDAYLAKAAKPASFSTIDTGPLSDSVLEKLFPLNTTHSDRLAITETDVIECKQSFGSQHWVNNCIRAIAAFSNNKGGYLAFGIKDKTWEIIGINRDKFKAFDRKNLNQVLRSSLSSGIEFDMGTFVCDGKTIGVMHILPARIKPVMLIKNVSGTTEGQIYYRYQGENRLIAPTELQHIIEERIRTLSETILSKHISNILSNGIENSAVLNLDTGIVDGKAGNFIVEEDLLPKIKFIKEGEFVEKSGAPTLKLIGKVSPKTIVTKQVIKEKKVLSDDDFPYKPTKAALEIARKSGLHFSSHNHTQAWRRYKARPLSTSKIKGRVNKEFCAYHKAHGDYTYSEEWIDHVVAKIGDGKEFSDLKKTKI